MRRLFVSRRIFSFSLNRIAVPRIDHLR